MEAVKVNLLKLLKIIISIAILMGTLSSILLMIGHIKMLPINMSYYAQEFTLLLCMFIAYLISERFDIKYFKSIAILGLIVSMFNLVGFRILIKLFVKG